MCKKHVLLKAFFGIAVLIVMSLLVFWDTAIGWAGDTGPYKFPPTIYWATGDVGSYPYATNAITAEKIAPVLGCKFRLIPGNDVEKVIMLRSGRAHLSFLSADLYWASMGLAEYSAFAFGPQPLRIIWAGWPSFAPSTGIATASSGIKTPYDLKGKRVIQIVGAAWSSKGLRAHLAFGNLTLNDVTIVEVSTTGASHKALTEGKGDYHIAGNTAPGAYEAESSPYGIYLVRFPHDDKQGWARLRNIMPYQVPGYATAGAGIKPGERVPVPMYPMPIYCTMANQADEFVYALCKAIYTKMDEIVAAYPANEGMRPERGIIPETTIIGPFHPGAIKFFKEIGIWKEAHETANKKRLAQLEKVNKRWLAYFEEANERMAKTGKKVDSTKEWTEIVEREIGLRP